MQKVMGGWRGRVAGEPMKHIDLIHSVALPHWLASWILLGRGAAAWGGEEG